MPRKHSQTQKILEQAHAKGADIWKYKIKTSTDKYESEELEPKRVQQIRRASLSRTADGA